MAKRYVLVSLLLATVFSVAIDPLKAQANKGNDEVIRVTVDLVQLDVAVTDKKGNYVTGLSPANFAIYEDGIGQKIATFDEGNEAPRRFAPSVPEAKPGLVASNSGNGPAGLPTSRPELVTEETADHPSSPISGASVFILFDTSNYMYRGFVFAQDAIAEFIRSLDHPYEVAFYSYSRDFFRSCRLTTDRSLVLRGVRTTVAGDDAALYNALLLTLKDAARLSGRKVVVVFSNGPDNASVVSPENVREIAQSEGITIYMISTQEAQLQAASTAVFKRMSASTGGKAYFAKNWRDEEKAFASIRDDLAHLYSFSYYPQPNPNHGWRTITVKLVGGSLKNYHIRTRSGYRPRAYRLSGLMNSDLQAGQPN
jgi:VWFA-related protein